MAAALLREDTVRLLKETANIVDIVGEHVKLSRSGANLKGLCPFHSEKTPSFIVNPERQTFHCFGCGEGGDVFTFMMNFHRYTFPESLQELARRYNIALPEKNLTEEEQARFKKREAIHKANEQASLIYHNFLLQDAEALAARKYLAERQVPPDIIERFRLGFAPQSWDFINKALAAKGIGASDARDAGLIVAKERGGHYDRFRSRILFPIFDLTGKVIAFGGRIVGDGQPKYLNSPETPVFDKSRSLFGLYQNKDAIRQQKKCVLVEGNFDLLSLVAQGIENVAAPLGTALTPFHIRALKGYADEAILLFDGDAAGLKAAMRSVPLFLTEQLPARVAILPGDHDPDTFVRAEGKEGLQKLLDAALSLPEFVFAKLVDQYGLTVEGKGQIIAELVPLIKATGNDHLQRTIFVTHFSKKLDLTPDQLLGGIKVNTSPAAASKAQAPAPVAVMPKKEEQLLNFVLLYPEFLQQFLEAGMDDVISDPVALTILDQLKSSARQGDLAGPELLLDRVTGPARTYISRLLISAPLYSDEEKTAEAEEKRAWLKKNSLKVQIENLNQQINEAHKSRNDELCMELMAKKKQMAESLAH